MKLFAASIGATALLAICSASAMGSGQTQTAPVPAAGPSNGAFRTTTAVNYRRARGSVKIHFQTTELLQGASGEAKIQSKNNRMEIEARFAGLEDATKFGLEYLTYVFWAISPQGRAENLGEVVLKKGEAIVKADTEMQTFGLIVTAEPYFAVTQPGNVVVLENDSATESAGKAENIDASYELLSRGAYSSSNTKIENAIFGVDRKTPLELFEARNAVRIANNAGAEKYALTAWTKAQQQLLAAEETYRQKRNRKVIDSTAKDATETAEESRVMAVKQKAEEDAQAQIAAEREAAEEREARARADAEAEERQRQEAEQARIQAEQAKTEAEGMKQEAEQAAQEALRQGQEADAARQAAETKTQEAEQAKAAAEAEAEKARQAAAQAETEKAQLRGQLLAQLNAVSQTRDSARGLIVNMSDVLFDSASYTPQPGAREKLAKISGILLAHPGLALQIEGHTDSVGSDEFNQQLSEQRASSVRDFLAEQGVPASSMTARGFGKTQPVASNNTQEGRHRNRRVELVVNGDAIGNPTTANAANQAN